jgi:hypothetical protein
MATSAQIWRIFGQKFGKVGFAVWDRMLVKLNGKFLAKHCAPESFCLEKKFVEFDLWPQIVTMPYTDTQITLSQFHQHLRAAFLH